MVPPMLTLNYVPSENEGLNFGQNTEAAVQFLKKFTEDSIISVSTVIPDGAITTESFKPDQLIPSPESRIYKLIEKNQGKSNIYFSVNPIKYELSKKAAKKDIKSLRYLHVDVDPRPRHDFESERKLIKSRIDKFTLKPSLIIDSGGGYQAFWKLKEPIPIESPEHATELEAYNKQLEILFDADHCFNVDRIMRVPFTVNLPTKSKIKKGRGKYLSSVVDFNNKPHDISAFVKASSPAQSIPVERKIDIGSNLPIIDVESLRLSNRMKAVIVSGNDLIDPYLSRSEAVFAVCCAMVRADYSDEEIASILMDRSNRISESILEKKNLEAYTIRQISRARERAVATELVELNSNHAFVRVGGKVGILTIPQADNLGGNLEILSPTAFKDWYQNRNINIGKKIGKEVYQQIGLWWLQHPKRRQYKGIVFEPGQKTPGYYNLWRDFSVKPKKGDCSKFLEHIRVNVAQGDEEYFNYIIGWFADIFQNPASKCGTSLVIRGKQGTGKTKIGEVIGSLLGPHYLITSSSRYVTGQFNSHLSSCILLHADEAFWAGDKAAEGKIKDLITGDSHLIEYKGREPFPVKNYMRLFITGNPEWVVHAGMEERRFAVFKMGEENIKNNEYFAAIDEEMDNGGREALLYKLLKFELSKVNLRKIPNTSELFNQKLNSLNSLESWSLTIFEEGVLPGYADVANECPTFVMCEDYVKHSKNVGIHHRKIQTEVGIFLNKTFPNIRKIKGEYTDHKNQTSSKVNFYSFPPLKECRKAFEKLIGAELPWDKEEDWEARNPTF